MSGFLSTGLPAFVPGRFLTNDGTQAIWGSITGTLSYSGTWNAFSNTPTLSSGVGTLGEYYVVSVAGTTNLDGITDWGAGDWAIFNGTEWQKIDNSDISGSGWNLSGNSGTNPITDFVGTLDNQPLVFRVNNTEMARFNLVKGFQWGNGSISNGTSSTAFGDGSTADGDYSTAFGTVGIASGYNSTAFGNNGCAEGENSTAFGDGGKALSAGATAFGNNTYAAGGMATTFGKDSVAGSYAALYANAGSFYDSLSNELYLLGDYTSLIGQTIIYYDNADGVIFTGEIATANYTAPFTTVGFTSVLGASTDTENPFSFVAIPSDDTFMATAFGDSTFAGGTGSTAWGSKSRALADNSTAFGIETIARGQYSIAGGRTAKANADGSIALGHGVTAMSDDEVAMGQYNTTYVPSLDGTDRVISLGNGTGTGSESDAFTVLKNGKAGIDMDNFEATTSGAKLQVRGYIGQTFSTVNGAFAFSADDITRFVNIDNSSGAFDLNLPEPSSVFATDVSGSLITSQFTFTHDGTNTANTVRILPYAGESINGTSSYTITGSERRSTTFYTDGTDWFVSDTNYIDLPISVSSGGTGATTAAGARTSLGVSATGADTTYAFRSNNLSDLASAATARINLGLQYTGDVDTALGGLTTTIANDAVTNAKFRNSAGLSLVGRSANSTGDVGDIAGTAFQYPVVSADGTTLGFSNGLRMVVTSMLANDTVALSLTSYYQPGSAQVDNATETNRQYTVLVAGTMNNLLVRTSNTQSVTGSAVITIRKNAADTALSVTIAAGSAAGIYTDLTNLVSVAARDLLSIQVTNNATIQTAQFNQVSFAII